MKNRQNLYDMIISLLIPVAVGSISALISRIPGRYAGMQQPPFSPPAIVFPIVWTALYILMGISAYMISRSEDARKSRALSVYALQLFFNFFWSILFFRFSWYLPAFFWLAAMIILILIMIFRFFQIKPLAAYLQILYLFWCLFAAYLNFGVYWLN
ncbi:MAG TPA: tryptophan-rich sensory protein [Candidatus Lachnoclostridium stercoravium]|uniref:Tryptophan-rich sensory protein n=1 Tax=Candidatus Lachnoclostridium stercoravium TaxID=2838633 RepID=A0A9D2HJE8_9FIRM|nr:tryptophan-rich sensory protein [Candidatus Lachnoclostridium stercoravium]